MKVLPMKYPTRFLAAGLSLAALLLPGCRPKAAPRNVLLVTLDTLRADHVGAIAPGNALTPNLDALARRGTLFKNAYSLIPITLPAHASILYSRPPHLLRNYNNGQVFLGREDPPPLPALFEKRGFATAGVVSLGVVRASFGLGRGFAAYMDDFPPDRWYLSAEEVNRRLFPWLEAHKDGPFFAWVHYSDPHEPYAPPGTPDDLDLYVNGARVGSYCLSRYTVNAAQLPLKTGRNEIRFEVRNEASETPYEARFDLFEFQHAAGSGLTFQDDPNWHRRKDDGVVFAKRTASIVVSNPGPPVRVGLTFRGKLLLPIDPETRQAYRREVEYMDAEIGKLWAKLEELGLLETTAILAVGDHGEGLGEYRTPDGAPYVGHIHFLEDVYMRVPLILANPTAPRTAEVREEPVTLLDVAPTIASLAGFKIPSGYQGRDLGRLPRGARLEIFEETYKPEAARDKFALLAYPWHVIFTPETGQTEAYRLAEGRPESEGLLPDEGLPPEAAALVRKLEAAARDVLKTKIAFKTDKKDEDMLRSLGYVNKK